MMLFAEEAREVRGQGIDELRPFGGLGAIQPLKVFLKSLDAEDPQPFGEPRLHHGDLVGGQGDARMDMQEIPEGAESGRGKGLPVQDQGIPLWTGRVAHAPTVAVPASSRMRPGTSRIRATRPSPGWWP